MDTSGASEFVHREWDAVASAKLAHWAERYRTEGWRVVWDAAQSLLDHARRVRHDFPSERDRELDLAHHLSLRASLDRASDAFTRR